MLSYISSSFHFSDNTPVYEGLGDKGNIVVVGKLPEQILLDFPPLGRSRCTGKIFKHPETDAVIVAWSDEEHSYHRKNSNSIWEYLDHLRTKDRSLKHIGQQRIYSEAIGITLIAADNIIIQCELGEWPMEILRQLVSGQN